jgi:hypothetical protein
LIHPAPGRDKPFALVADGKDIDALNEAEAHPQILMLADWYHNTSENINAGYRLTGVDPM